MHDATTEKTISKAQMKLSIKNPIKYCSNFIIIPCTSVSKKRNYINNVLGLLTLDEKIRQFIKDGLICFDNAIQLIGLDNAMDVAELIIREDLSPSQTEKYLKRLKNPISNSNEYNNKR